MHEDNFMKNEHILMGEYRKAGGFGGGNRGGGFGGGRPSFGGGRPSFKRSGDRESGPKEMFPATCSSCHKACEIPFRPSGDRPVYCRDCFGSQEGSAPESRGRRDDPGGESRFPRNEYSPSNVAPKAPMEDKRIDGLKRQLDDVSAKVDQILNILNLKNAETVISGKSLKKKIDVEGVQDAVQSIIEDMKTAKKAAKESVVADEKKVVKKKPAAKKA